MNNNFEKHFYHPDFTKYWDFVKNVIDENGWVYSKEVPHLLDSYFETNTNIKIDFEKSYEYEGSYRGYRWRPSSIKEELK
jgi:hypothetical protein